MKHTLLALIILTLFMNCAQSSENRKDFSKIMFSTDTVMVDSKDEILYLRSGLNVSDLAVDGKYLYNLNPMDLTLEIIDLDQLEFVRRITYEEEGPNGLGRYARNIQVLSDEELFLGSFSQRGIFDLNGIKIKNLNFKVDDLGGDIIPPKYSERLLLVNPEDPNRLFTVWNTWEQGIYIFGIVDAKAKTYQDIHIPDFDYMADFRMILYNEGNPMVILGDGMEMKQSNNKVILSNNVGSDLYVFDRQKESLQHKTFNHQLIPFKKSLKLPSRVESQEEFQEYNRKFGEDINFTAPNWDRENKVYYRFAFFRKSKELDGRMISTEAEVFLVILDEDFNLLIESPLDELNKEPSFHFVKDGKIWIFENMEDEMGFVRLSIMP